jgi:hypothetical protein
VRNQPETKGKTPEEARVDCTRQNLDDLLDWKRSAQARDPWVAAEARGLRRHDHDRNGCPKKHYTHASRGNMADKAGLCASHGAVGNFRKGNLRLACMK